VLLLVKLALAPALVVGSSLAGRRWGHQVSGLLVALPLVAGPILLIVELEHGRHFASKTAAAALLGLVALCTFVVVFAQVARRGRWPLAVLAGWAGFLAVALAFGQVTLPAGVGLVFALGAFALAPHLLPEDPPEREDPLVALPAWDLPARALATALLVLGLTGAAAGLGPRLTGVLTPFPVSNTVLAVFVLVLEGPVALDEFFRGFLRGAYGFAAFCFLVAVLVIPLGPAGAFLIALCGALVVQLLTLVIARARDARVGEAGSGAATGALSPRAGATGSARADR